MTYNEKSLFWRGQRLYFKPTSDNLILENVKSPPVMQITPHERFPKMFYVEWPDGVKSADMYNLTRAKDHCVSIALGTLNKDDPPSEI